MALNNLTRYALMSGGMRPDHGGSRMEYGGTQNEYRYEGNYRGGDMRNEHRDEPIDARFRDRRGREHYDNGRYAPMRSERQDGENMRSGGYPMWEQTRMGGDDDDEPRRKWTITENRGGEYMPTRFGNMNPEPDKRRSDMWPESWYEPYAIDANYEDVEEKAPNVIGFSAASQNSMRKNGATPMNKEMADEWMGNIINEDGTKGAHWSLGEIKSLMQQKGIECDPVMLWVAMNAEYSDRQKVAKKYGVDRNDFYLDSAIAFWLKDADAVKDKLSAYYTYVVKH